MNGHAPLLLWINACALVGFTGMSIILTDYLIREIWYYGWERYRFQGALALYAVAVGGATSFGVRWWMRYIGELEPIDGSATQNTTLIGGGVFLVVGLLCWMRVWTPKEWRPWPVLITACAMPALALGGPVFAVLVTAFLLACWAWRRMVR